MMRDLIRDDEGAYAVMVAVLVVVFVALSVLVVDLGYMYDVRRQLQASAEAGALAGCQELIASENAGLADAEARAYVEQNAAGGPLGGAVAVERVDVDTGEGSVRVVVRRDSPALFGAYFGNESYTVRAAAKARKWALTGSRYLLPWAIPLIRNVDYVEAVVTDSGGGVISSSTLDDNGDRTYSGHVTAPSSPGAYQVRVRIWNEYGVVERIVDSSDHEQAAGAILTTGGAWPFTSVTLSDDYVTAGSTGPLPVLTVHTLAPPTEPVRVYVGNKARTMTAVSPTSFTYQLSSSDIDLGALDLMTVYPLDVRIGTNTRNIYEAYLHVRRSTHPVEEVAVSPSSAAPGASIGVNVTLDDFDPVTVAPGTTYTLRVGSPASQVGNYGELNFNTLVHQASCPPDTVDVPSGNRYFDWTAYGYPGGVHIGDLCTTSPGSSGVNTFKALNERAGWDPEMTVAVPVVEKYEDKGGSYDVIIIDFASFHITSYTKEGDVEAEFIRYIANPSTYAGSPGGSLTTVYSARLVNP